MARKSPINSELPISCGRFPRETSLAHRHTPVNGETMYPHTVVSIIFLSLVFCLAAAGTAGAAQSFAVAPFAVHAPEKYQYLSQGIPSVITSSLESKTALQSRDLTLPDRQDTISRSDARKLLKDSDLDFLVYGNVTIMEGQSNLSLKVLSRDGKLVARNAQAPMNKLIPRLNTLIGDVKPELAISGERRQEARADIEMPDSPKDQEKDAEQKTLNPQFERTERASEKTGRWRSPALSLEARGLRVGDVDGDGRQEIILLQKHAVKAFVRQGDKLEHLATYETGSRTKTLTLDLTAAKADGSREIVVSALRQDKPRSFILRYRDGDFAVRDKSIKLLLKVARIPPDYNKRLVGQKLDSPGNFANGVSLVQRGSSSYKLGRTLELPRAANVFNFTYLPGKEDSKVVVADASIHLRLYSDGKIQATTDKAYAGSSVKMRKKTSLPGLEDSREDPPSYRFLPTRLISCDLNADGEFEILVNRSVSSTSKYLANQRSFSEGSIHSLYWDGLGLSTAWKTGAIKGAVQDYGLGDMNNDGTLELYVCLTTSPGTFSWDGKKTILLAYPLELSKESRGKIFRP